MSMGVAEHHHGPLARLWEWLGWRSHNIAATRTQDRGARERAREKLQSTHERARQSNDVSDWLRKRHEENHIAEALAAALKHPRKGS